MLVAAACALFSCGHKSAAPLDPGKVKSIVLADNNGKTVSTLSENDKQAIAGYISRAGYDAALNDGSIAVRPAAPDYTLIVSHTSASVSDDWVRIWIASGRTMLRSEWYTLRPEDLPGVAAILKKY